MMEWMDKDLSTEYHVVKLSTSKMENTTVVVSREILRLSVKLSVIKVLTTLMSTTASQ